MTATLHILDGEPILIVTYEGYVTLQITEEVTAQVVEIMDATPDMIYGIIDVTRATTDLAELLRIIAHQSTGARGTLVHHESYVVLVGTHVLLRLFQKLMRERKFGGVTLSIYYTLDEALSVVRRRIQTDKQQTA
ncbi:MAG TPA: hypothetical protein VHD90_06845 [Phototrophicaceae bacterium]|nr:hypothetical protein [Phototrophicaceae bacterium]